MSALSEFAAEVVRTNTMGISEADRGFLALPDVVRDGYVNLVARCFLSECVLAAGEAWRIESGTFVNVTSSKRVPAGRYVVRAHFVPPGSHGAVVTIQDPLAKPGSKSAQFWPRVPVGDVEVIPDFRHVFEPFGHESRWDHWAAFLPGMFHRGFGVCEVGMIADRVEEDGVIGFSDHDEFGVPAAEFARHLRSLPVPTVAASTGAIAWNFFCRR